MFVADDAGQGYAAQGRVAEGVTPLAVFFIHFYGAELLEPAQLMLDGGFVICPDDDDGAHALRVQVGEGQAEHAADAGAYQGKAVYAEVVHELDLSAGLVVGIHHGETAAPRLAIGCEGGGAGAAVAAAHKVDADDEIALCIQWFAGAYHLIPPAFKVFGLPKAAGLGQGVVITMGVVAAGEGVEEQNGVAFLCIECAVGFIGKLNIRYLHTVVEREIADVVYLCGNGAGHALVCVGGDYLKKGAKKRTGVTNTPVSFLLPRMQSATGLFNALLAQASAGSGALASLELGVALADDVQRTLTLHDLAISVAALHGGE